MNNMIKLVTFRKGDPFDTWLLLECGHHVRQLHNVLPGQHKCTTCPHTPEPEPVQRETTHGELVLVGKMLRKKRELEDIAKRNEARKKKRLEAREAYEVAIALKKKTVGKKGFWWRGRFRETE